MDRTLRKSQTRNNDGERQMISLLEIAQSINEVDDDKIIKYKDKDGESQEMTAGAAKKQPDDHPAKVAYNKMSGDDGDDSEKDAGGKLGGSDFERDGGDSEKVDGPSPEDDWDNEQVMTAKIGGEEVGDIINNPNHTNYDKAMDYVMSFNPDDEKLVTGPGSDDNAESDDIEISDANSGPIDRDDIMDMLKNDSEVVDKMGDDVYWDGVDLVSSKFDDDTIASVDGNMTLGDLKKQIMDYEEEQDESIKVIDGKKYKAIKESKKNPRLFKEIYERTFRSLK